jgi:hypothetical protein
MSLTSEDLTRFTGTERYWQEPLLAFKYTDGVHYLATEGDAYWLLTDISAFQQHAAIVDYKQRDNFQLWHLQVRPDHTALLTCDDGNGQILFTHAYHYTTFPLTEIKLYLVDDVLLLPSEY